MKEKTHKKLNISLPADLHAFCLQKKKEEQEKNPLATVPISKIIALAVREMKEEEDRRKILMNDKPNATAPNARPSSHTFSRGKTRRQ
jgi:hypothetical protein